MKKHYSFYLLFLAGVIFTACTFKDKKPSKRLKSQTRETALANHRKTDSSLLQAIVLPNSEVLFVVIDPHGDGKLAIRKFRKVASELNVNVIGLNNVLNNTPGFIDLIAKDIQSSGINYRYLIMAGFSGGARMAFQYALKKNTDGVIMCGAGPGQMMNQALPFPLVMIAGTRDFNFVEQYYPPSSALAANVNLLALPFEGIHEWPGENSLFLTSKFILSKLNINQNFKKESSQINQQFNTYRNEGKLFLAFKQLEALSKIYPDDSLKKKCTKFTNKPDFKKYMGHFQAILAEEMNRNQELIQDLNSKDEQWWYKTINKINSLMKDQSHRLESDSYARTKAFIGVLMYSVVSKEIRNPDSPNLEKYLKIYEKLEPDNPDLKRYKEKVYGK
jgi:predicted esterase